MDSSKQIGLSLKVLRNDPLQIFPFWTDNFFDNCPVSGLYAYAGSNAKQHQSDPDNRSYAKCWQRDDYYCLSDSNPKFNPKQCCDLAKHTNWKCGFLIIQPNGFWD